MKKAFITGINGQDGSYLAELLLGKGYEVHGIIRRASIINTKRIDHLMCDRSIFNKSLFVHYGDVTDSLSIANLISTIKPDEVYNLAAQSHVKISFELPQYTAQVDAIGTLNILEAIRMFSPNTKMYQASTSELYGGMSYNSSPNGYTESSPMHPRSPYGCAKMYSLCIVRNYREAYGMFAVNGILFNHESPRRNDVFVTKKITNWMRKFKDGMASGNMPAPLELGNLYAKRDWGHAKDYVEAMWLMLQHDMPEDFVIATNETYSVKEFINECLLQLGITDAMWVGTGTDEKLIQNNNVLIKINERHFRPSEVEVLLGDSSKAKNILKWQPKYSFKTLIEEMLNEP